MPQLCLLPNTSASRAFDLKLNRHRANLSQDDMCHVYGYYQRNPGMHCIYPFAVSMDQDNTGQRGYNVFNSMIYTLNIEHQIPLPSKCGIRLFCLKSKFLCQIIICHSRIHLIEMRITNKSMGICSLKEKDNTLFKPTIYFFYLSHFHINSNHA